jgi:hypothetical protein
MSDKPEIDQEEVDRCLADGPQSTLEKMLLEAYLEGKGYHLDDLKNLPPDEAQTLMKEACAYASMKLAEVESKAQFRREIHYES